MRQVVEFVTGEPLKQASRHDSESQRLEYELFYREERASLNSTRLSAPSPASGL